MSDGQIGWDTTLSIEGTTVGNIVSVSGPDQSINPVDISTMDSPERWMEFIRGMKDAGELTVELNYDGGTGGAGTSNAKILDNAFNLTTPTSATSISVTWPSFSTTTTETSGWSSGGFVTGLGKQTPHDDKIMQTVTIKLSGKGTFTD
jgi:hypothetical protein